jgi:glycerophosphoryl diester phosphodiesterase
MFKNLVGSLVLSVLGVLACRQGDEPQPAATTGTNVAPLQVKRGLLIAHGLGGIDGLRNTNSLEALRCNYKRGFRWFDVDVAATSDDEPVAFHKGDEKSAGLSQPISSLPITEVEGKKYAGRYPITRLSKLLDETDQLGDVVLVFDTAGWSERMEHALSRTLGYGPKHSTRFILQVYREKDLSSISRLGKEVGAGILINLHQSEADDAKVEEMAKKASPLAVVTSTERFTPWLAERLHAINTPVLVQTVNDHRDIVSLTRAGADGFYTDRYVPFATLAADPTAVLNCGETKPSAEALAPWTRRDLQHPADVQLPSCATRKGRSVELTNCDDKASLRSDALDVPPGQAVHVELDAEAGDRGVTSFWLDLVQKLRKDREPKPLRPRELISLKAKERRTFKYDVELPQGSRGVEARIGLASNKDRLILYRLRVYQGDAPVEPPVQAGSDDQDGGTAD